MIPKNLIIYVKDLNKNTRLIHIRKKHDTFKHLLLFLYTQSKLLPGLVYIRIDNPDDSVSQLGHRKITKFYKRIKTKRC